MIREVYYVMDPDLDCLNTFTERAEADECAQEAAENNGEPRGVFLMVPVGGTDMPEARAVTVYDDNGREAFRSHAYDSELVPA